MRIFVSEFLTSGAWATPEIPASLLREGTAMLSAIAGDFAQVPGCEVLTTWDRRFGSFPLSGSQAENIEACLISDPEEEKEIFQEFCREAGAAFLIAPEFQNLLADRCELVNRIGTFSLNCSVESIRRATDKLSLAGELESRDLPTIPTREFAEPYSKFADEWGFPLVIKPRDGAGSQDTFLVHDGAEWNRLLASFSSASRAWIVQPYIPGRTLSVAAIVGEVEWNDEPWLEVFPLAEQHLTGDGRFGYLGGRIPETIALQHVATQRFREIARLLPGLSGYVGIDLLAPRQNPEELLIVEINPRLTTSYLGYRALADGNLAEYLLPQCQPEMPLRWKPNIVRFTCDGVITWDDPAEPGRC